MRQHLPPFEQWKLRINGAKSDTICFTKKIKKPRHKYSINSKTVNWKRTTKYLSSSSTEGFNKLKPFFKNTRIPGTEGYMFTKT